VGEHRRIGKDIGYEESVRVPLLVAGPGFDTGARRGQQVSLVDIAPTVAAAAKATPGLLQDGLPLQTFTAGPGTRSRRPILFEGGPTPEDPDRWYTAIHTNRYVYTEYRTTDEKELYDLHADPLQLDNLAVLSPGSTTERALAGALADLRDCAGAECRRPR
jgi:N-acetylglucosamine-6-sulfatase